MKFGELKTGEETVTPNWVFDVLGTLTLASDMKVLAFLARHRLYRHSTYKTWEIAGETGLDPRTTQASLKRLGEAGHIVSADGEHCLRGACARPAQPLHKSTRTKPHSKPRQDGKKPTSEVKEVREEMEQPQEREFMGGMGTEAPRTLSLEEREETGRAGTAGGAPGASAPGGAGSGPRLALTGPPQSPASAGNTQATSTENVPPGGPDDTRNALEVAFGPQFLAQLVRESPLRRGWLTLPASQVAALHQEALEACADSPRPWRTLLIHELDHLVAPGRRGKGNLRLERRREDIPADEWLA